MKTMIEEVLNNLGMGETPLEKKAREIANSIHPSREVRALKYVQSDKTAMRPIDTVVPLAGNGSVRQKMKDDINAAVFKFMGVKPTWEYMDDGYYRVKSEGAVKGSLADRAHSNLKPLY